MEFKSPFRGIKSNNIPMAFSLFILLSTSIYFVAITVEANQDLEKISIIEANEFSIGVSNKISSQVDLIDQILVPQWTQIDNEIQLFSYQRYLDIIPNFYSYSASYLALNWINISGVINYVYPLERNAEAINESVVHFVDGRFNEALFNANATKITHITDLIPFYQGGNGLAAYIPVLYNDTVVGFFNLVFELNPLIVEEVEDLISFEDFSFYIYEGDTEVEHMGENFTLSDSYVVSNTISFYNKIWMLLIRPNHNLRTDVFLNGSIIFLLGGILALLSFYLTRQIYHKNQLLEEEYRKKEEVKQLIWQNQKLEALGTLAGGIAHDFNNLLMGIQGNVSILNDFVFQALQKNKSITDHLKDEMKDSLKSISDTLIRAKELTFQILTFSRHQDVEFEYFDIIEEIKSSIKFISETSDRKLKIVINDKSENTNLVLGNKTKFYQVMMNIMLNSIDAQSTYISINIRRVKFNLDGENLKLTSDKYPPISFNFDQSLKIEIIDNGSGMTDDELSMAFDPFFTTKGIGKGTGLGLVIVRQIINSLQGMIKIRSDGLMGTNVELFLPLIEEVQEEKDVALEEIIENAMSEKNHQFLSGSVILLLEDEETIQKSLIKYLEKSRVKVHSFNNGLDALEFVQTKDCSLSAMIVDINIPGIDGIEFSRRVWDLNPEQKILFITGYSQNSLPNLDKKNVHALEKPFTSSQFINGLKKLLLD